MISLRPLADPAPLAELKARYLRGLTTPMDDMWETGIVDPAPHTEIRLDASRAGYFAAKDMTLLQFFLLPAAEPYARTIFNRVLSDTGVTHAEVATSDPMMLPLCLDTHRKLAVHTVLYELPDGLPLKPPVTGHGFRPVEPGELERTIKFQVACLGSETDLSGWLRGYSGNRIDRGELFVLHDDDAWVGLGERRRSDSQTGVVHVGMMVSPEHRGSGWATDILRRVCAPESTAGRRVVCSTTVENAAARKAIERTGFVGRHRIARVTF